MPKEQAQKDQEEVQKQEEQSTEEKSKEASESTDDSKEKDDNLWAGIDENHPVRQVVRDVRSEAAARRTEVKELREALDEFKEKVEGMQTPADLQKAVDEANQRAESIEQNLIRERVGRTHHLPESLISRLSGKTEEEIIADAKKLQTDLGIDPEGRGHQGPPKPPPRGGLQPGADRSVEVDALVSKLRKGNRNF